MSDHMPNRPQDNLRTAICDAMSAQATKARERLDRWAALGTTADLAVAKLEAEEDAFQRASLMVQSLAEIPDPPDDYDDELAVMTKRAEKAEKERDDLVQQIVELFGYTDKSYLHAAMHLGNAVKNLRADVAAARVEALPQRALLDHVVRCKTCGRRWAVWGPTQVMPTGSMSLCGGPSCPKCEVAGAGNQEVFIREEPMAAVLLLENFRKMMNNNELIR
jgi:hypothetical protein